MLEIKDIKKEYKTEGLVQKALDGVSMNLRDSEFVAVLGPSGSGKTTLLNIIGGLDKADSGELVINGISTAKYKDREWDTYRNHTIGFVFQSYNLIPHQSVLSNVELALTISGIPGKERKKRAEKALSDVGLSEHIHKLPNQLSGGQMQRVAIARALVNDPEIVLADEPTGALDSETGLQVMDLLEEVSKDRLVVMVTHNPELANQYATRIIRLKDGKVTEDSDPFVSDEKTENRKEQPSDGINTIGISPAFNTPKPESANYTADSSDVNEITKSNSETASYTSGKSKASMSFLTALALSFNNLMTKKARTLLVAFAGSIGIIGIALILSLSNGVNKYIDDVERETLSEYPVQIQSTGFDISSFINTEDDSTKSAKDEMTEGDVGELKTITNMFTNSSTNDLKSFKEYLDSGKSGISNYTSAIEYKYNVTPLIYRMDDKNEARQVNPDQSFTSLGLGGSSSTSNQMMSYAMSTDSFFDLPESEKTYKGQYDVKAGHWPENEHELVLVLTKRGSVSEMVLFYLGIRDPDDLKDAVEKFASGKDVTFDEERTRFDYSDFLGQEFRLVINSDCYGYDVEQGVYIDKSDNKKYMKRQAKKGEKLVIAGIVQPKEDSDVSMLQTGIGYSPDLVNYIIKKSKKSDVVKAQLKNPDINVLTGKRFGDDDEENGFDLEKLFSIDETALRSAFNFDTGGLTLDESSLAGMDLKNIDMSSIMSGVKFNVTEKEMNKLFNKLMKGYQKSIKGDTAKDPMNIANDFTAFMETPEAQKVIAQVTPDMSSEEQQKKMQELYSSYAAYVAKNGKTDQNEIMSGFTEYINTPAAQSLLIDSVGKMIDTKGAEKVASRELKSVITGYMKSAMAQLSSGLENAMTVDPEAFANAIKVNMDADDLESMLASMSMKEPASYEGNMKNFGYADLTDPSMILIYPKDFDCKEKVTGIIDGYNDEMKKTGEDDKVITYSDIVGTLMTSVTDIINQISMVLIAFVAISLLVSSIMIGVITYISVLERKKEIGILRAMGASKLNIANVFNAETFIIGALAGVLGIVITLLLLIPGNEIIKTLAEDTSMRARMPASAAVILILLSMILTLIGGWIPSRKAAKSDPVAALRTE